MKKYLSLFYLLAVAALLSGCVSRTMTTGPKNRGQTHNGKAYGADPKPSSGGEKKIIWIWQDEYRNSK